MTSFYPAVPAATQYTSEQLDRVALAGGCLADIGLGFEDTSEVPSEQHGYGFRWIDRRGCGNRGRLVLVGRTPRTRGLLRRGRIARLAAVLGVSDASAALLDRAADGVKYGREIRVMRAAHSLAMLPPGELASFPGLGNGVRTWRHHLLQRHPGMSSAVTADVSCDRLAAAAEVAKRLCG